MDAPKVLLFDPVKSFFVSILTLTSGLISFLSLIHSNCHSDVSSALAWGPSTNFVLETQSLSTSPGIWNYGLGMSLIMFYI